MAGKSAPVDVEHQAEKTERNCHRRKGLRLACQFLGRHSGKTPAHDSGLDPVELCKQPAMRDDSLTEREQFVTVFGGFFRRVWQLPCFSSVLGRGTVFARVRWIDDFSVDYAERLMDQPIPGKLYVRQSSGLVREFSAFDTFVFNTLGYALGLVLASAPTFLGGLYPNANVYLVLTLGVIFSVFNGLIYGLFSAAMPRSGGDYVYIGRTLHPSLGFAANWGFTWSQFFGLGVYTGMCVTDALIPALTTFGYAAGIKPLVNAGNSLNEPVFIWLIGTGFLLTVFFISVAGTRTLKRFLNLFFVIAVVGTLCMMTVFLNSSREEFVREFNSFMAANANLTDAYQAVIRMGETKGLRTGQPTDIWSAILALPVGYWVFIGFTYSVYVGGEVKEPQKSQSLAILGALLSGYVLYMVVIGRYYEVVGRDFNNAVALIKDDSDSPLIGGGSMTFMSGLLTKNLAINFLISLSTFLWFYLLLFVMAAVCIRNLFAWSYDRLMPEGITRVSGRTGVPIVATLVMLGLAEVFLTLHAFFKIAFINYIAMFSVCFLIAGIAAIVFPYRRPALFQNAPPIVRTQVVGLPLITIAGMLNVVLFIIVLYSSLTNPGVSGVQGSLPSAILVVIYGTGFIIYYIARGVRLRQGGVDLNRLYDEIPPE